MKRPDAEFLRDWYSSFTLDYEHISEQLFMTQLYLAIAVTIASVLIGILAFVML